MHGGPAPVVRQLTAGEFLFRQAEPGTSLAVILDGTFEVRVNGDVAGQVGPGTGVGERAPRGAARRPADLRPWTRAGVAEPARGLFPAKQLSELAQGPPREDSAASR